jgi:hypothetical protein
MGIATLHPSYGLNYTLLGRLSGAKFLAQSSVVGQITLSHRVPGSSPGAPTIAKSLPHSGFFLFPNFSLLKARIRFGTGIQNTSGRSSFGISTLRRSRSGDYPDDNPKRDGRAYPFRKSGRPRSAIRLSFIPYQYAAWVKSVKLAKWGQQMGEEEQAKKLKYDFGQCRMVSKKDAAHIQILTALSLLHEGQWECAITLAGAAEGQIEDAERPTLFKMLKNAETRKRFKNEREYVAFVNEARDWLKHGGDQKDKTIYEWEAIIMVGRALSKYLSAYRDNLDEVKAFDKWCKAKGFTTVAS